MVVRGTWYVVRGTWYVVRVVIITPKLQRKEIRVKW